MQKLKKAWSGLCNSSDRISYLVGNVAFPLGCLSAGALAARVGILQHLPISEGAKTGLYGGLAGVIAFIADYAPYLLMIVGAVMLFNTSVHFRQDWKRLRSNGGSTGIRTEQLVALTEGIALLNKNIVDMRRELSGEIKALAEQIARMGSSDADKK